MSEGFQEILTVLAAVVVIGGVIFWVAEWLDRVAWRIEQALNLGANGLLLFIMLFVVSEVFMRYMFNSPIPGHLEMSELFTPGIIFLAIAYTQSTDGHVRMTLVIDMLPQWMRRYADIFTLTLSVAIYAILTYFSALHTHRTWLYGDNTMQYYYPVWPSTLVVTVGLFFCTLRLYLDTLQAMFPNRIHRVTVDTHAHIQSE